MHARVPVKSTDESAVSDVKKCIKKALKTKNHDDSINFLRLAFVALIMHVFNTKQSAEDLKTSLDAAIYKKMVEITDAFREEFREENFRKEKFARLSQAELAKSINTFFERISDLFSYISNKVSLLFQWVFEIFQFTINVARGLELHPVAAEIAGKSLGVYFEVESQLEDKSKFENSKQFFSAQTRIKVTAEAYGSVESKETKQESVKNPRKELENKWKVLKKKELLPVPEMKNVRLKQVHEKLNSELTTIKKSAGLEKIKTLCEDIEKYNLEVKCEVKRAELKNKLLSLPEVKVAAVENALELPRLRERHAILSAKLNAAKENQFLKLQIEVEAYNSEVEECKRYALSFGDIFKEKRRSAIQSPKLTHASGLKDGFFSFSDFKLRESATSCFGIPLVLSMFWQQQNGSESSPFMFNKTCVNRLRIKKNG